jgi:CheY-like chemotaxis protein
MADYSAVKKIAGLVFCISLGAVFILALCNLFYSLNFIVKPLSKIEETLKKASADEQIDLGMNIDIKLRNEIGLEAILINRIFESINDLTRVVKKKIDALTNTGFEISTNMSRTSIAVKKLSMSLSKIKSLIARQETEAAEADKAVVSIKSNLDDKKVSLSTIETLLKHTEEFVLTSKETVSCLNEIVQSVNQVNNAVNSVNDMSIANNRNFEELKMEMEKYKTSTGSKKILLVDDDEIHILITENMLKADFEIVTAKSGEEALNLFYHGLVPTIILLDLIMPDMDGWDTFERIRAIGGLHDVPIAFFTSSFEIDDIKRAFDIGVNDYISKPVEKEELMKTIGKLLRK